MPEYSIKIRSASAADLDGLTDLIHRAATANAILPRSREQISEYLETFVVAEHDGVVSACAALAAVDPSHAEIRSVAVDPIVQKLGVGLRLVRFLVDVAEQVEISRLFLVTTKPGFFARAGFVAEDLEGSAASYLQSMLHRNGRSLEGKFIMTLDLDNANFTQHTVESVEHLPATTASPLWLDHAVEVKAVIPQPKPRRGLPLA
ncbi:MAG: N-acetylglutamate synthase-like GNAT family acetyltransferase [Phycisphaerales bacterium]|jgi:N-acetylglutamate synthase-like GNAT family acetyltransferase